MRITIQELTTSGPTIHSAFKALPFQRSESDKTHLARPVLAYQSPSCIKIVGDIHRFLSAQDKGHATLPVYLIQETESTLDLLHLVIEYYAPMCLMDKALLTQAAIDLGVPRSILAEKIYPSIELAPREKVVEQMLFLLKLPPELQTFITDKDLSLKRALVFQRAEQHLDWVTQFISNLRIGINMTAEIIQNIWELAQLDEMDFKTKAIEMGLWDMATTEYADSRLAVMEIRERINQARYPTLSAAGKKLTKTLEALELPPGLSIKWDPYFEKQGIDVQFHAKDNHELIEIIDKLTTPGFKDIFRQI